MSQQRIANKDIPNQTIVLFGPLAETQLLQVAQTILEVRGNRNIYTFFEDVWGDVDEIETFMIGSTSYVGEDEIRSITAFDNLENLRMPDLKLSFWQDRLSDASLILGQLDECKSDEARLDVLNYALYTQGIFKDYGLPDPQSEHPAFQRKVKLSSVPVTYPQLYETR